MAFSYLFIYMYIGFVPVSYTHLVKDVDIQKNSSHEAHKRLWAKNEEQDKRINDHEKRLSLVERKGE